MKVTWGYDEDSYALNPLDPQNDCAAWTHYSFNSRHINFKHPEELGLGPIKKPAGRRPAGLMYFPSTPSSDRTDPVNASPTVRNPGLRRKLEVGLAFFLDYFEHGQCKWSLHNCGPQCPWDTSRFAGLLVWEHDPKVMGPKSYEDRAKDAAAVLEEYTAWCNGEAYWFKVEDDNGEEVDGCGGILGYDGLRRMIAEYKGAEVVGPE